MYVLFLQTLYTLKLVDYVICEFFWQYLLAWLDFWILFTLWTFAVAVCLPFFPLDCLFSFLPACFHKLFIYVLIVVLNASFSECIFGMVRFLYFIYTLKLCCRCLLAFLPSRMSLFLSACLLSYLLIFLHACLLTKLYAFMSGQPTVLPGC